MRNASLFALILAPSGARAPLACVLVLLCIASSASAQSPALDAIRARCPALRVGGCVPEDADRPDRDVASEAEGADGTLEGDHARLVTDCSGSGNGGGLAAVYTYDVDLAHCRATVAYSGYEQTAVAPFDTVFQVFGLTQPPAQPLPTPPGVAFRPNDPAFAATQLALAGHGPARRTITQGDFVVSSPELSPQAPVAGLPAAEPPTYLSVTELRAIGATPSPRPTGPGRFLRAYRLTAGIAAPREVLRVGDFTVLGTSECIAVVHRPSSTFRRVLCQPATLEWIGGADGIAIAKTETQGYSGERTALFAIDLQNGTAHEIHVTIPNADDYDDALGDAEIAVRDGALVVRLGESAHRIALADLRTAMRASAR